MPAQSLSRRLTHAMPLLLVMTAPILGCESPQEPLDEPATPPPPSLSAKSDSNTLLLLRFNNSLSGLAGEQPSGASGLTFEPGMLFSGVLVNGTDRLAYPTSGNFRAAAGTVEFWFKPRWNGSDHGSYSLFTLGDAFTIAKDGADNLRFVLKADDSEANQAYNVAHWVANQWHFVAVTWTVPGMMKTYVDGVEVISHSASARDLITSVPADLLVGSREGPPSYQARGVFDNLRISNIARTPAEIAESYGSDIRILSLTIQPITSEPFETWRQPAKLLATTNAGDREYPPSEAAWSSSNPAVATVSAEGVIEAIKSGTTTIRAVIGGVQGKLALRVKAPVLPPKVEAIKPYLATPAANALYQVPVVILRYLPTADGVYLDPAFAPSEAVPLVPTTLAEMKRRLDTADVRTKFMLEEGSRFRGYQDPNALPSIGYRVVAYITVYEPTPPGRVMGQTGGFPVYQPDYYQILERFNGRRYVEELGVKEFWLWQNHFDAGFGSYDPSIHQPVAFRGLDESNMASPVTGDISNSRRDPTDMPIYSRTYVLYGQNMWRAGSEPVHNRGHQLESMLEYVNLRQDGNADLFWNQFVGLGILGRCGWTEVPPNTTVNYDYNENYQLVPSDIADWSPEGIGVKTPVNASTWGEHAYPWPLGTRYPGAWERNEAHWYIYWMQSMPGRGNTIPYGVDGMDNWWKFTGNWDGSIKAGVGLYALPTKPISISTARDAVRTLQGQVNALAAAGKLGSADAGTLRTTLNAAAQLLDNGQMQPATDAMRRYRSQLVSMVDSGRVVRANVRTMLEGTRWLISRMGVS